MVWTYIGDIQAYKSAFVAAQFQFKSNLKVLKFKVQAYKITFVAVQFQFKSNLKVLKFNLN